MSWCLSLTFICLVRAFSCLSISCFCSSSFIVLPKHIKKKKKRGKYYWTQGQFEKWKWENKAAHLVLPLAMLLTDVMEIKILCQWIRNGISNSFITEILLMARYFEAFNHFYIYRTACAGSLGLHTRPRSTQCNTGKRNERLRPPGGSSPSTLQRQTRLPSC